MTRVIALPAFRRAPQRVRGSPPRLPGPPHGPRRAAGGDRGQPRRAEPASLPGLERPGDGGRRGALRHPHDRLRGGGRGVAPHAGGQRVLIESGSRHPVRPAPCRQRSGSPSAVRGAAAHRHMKLAAIRGSAYASGVGQARHICPRSRQRPRGGGASDPGCGSSCCGHRRRRPHVLMALSTRARPHRGARHRRT